MFLVCDIKHGKGLGVSVVFLVMCFLIYKGLTLGILAFVAKNRGKNITHVLLPAERGREDSWDFGSV